MQFLKTARARRTALTAVRRKLALFTPGSSTGAWNARNTPAAARASGSIASRSSPLNDTVPADTSYSSRPAST